MRYWLRRHVYVCAPQDSVVFLDVKRDRYFGLSGRQLEALSMVVEGWPSVQRPSSTIQSISISQAIHVADQCVAAGLLTQDLTAGKPAAPPALSLTADLVSVGVDVRSCGRVRPLDTLHFIIACLRAVSLLRFRPLEAIVRRVAGRKQQAPSNSTSDSLETLVTLVCKFRKLRSFLPTDKDQCLFLALALIEFLAHYRQFPTWVIGVQTNPWAAHSWVQQESLVLDASPETVRFYTPILAI